MDYWIYVKAAFDVQCANPFWSVYLMRRDRHHINAQASNAYWDFASDLYGVSVKERASIMCNFGKLLHRLYSADFIVRVHDTYERDIARYRAFQINWSDHSFWRHREVRYRKTHLFKVLTSL